MGKDLIIVESPAKVKTIKKFLGSEFNVQASVGHVRDLPKSSIGVDEEHDFKPAYEVIKGKEKIVADLQSAAAKAHTVFLAPDPDREGEAIAWHVAELVKEKNPNIKRIEFNEITHRAVTEALKHPRELNKNLFDAQQARRILDRLVGYKISPLLWKVKRGISAGRVQSVALRLIVEREEERNSFVPKEYWVIKALFEGNISPAFLSELWKVDNKKAEIPHAEAAQAIEELITGQPALVKSVEEKKRERTPVPPFITSTLQQSANQRFSYSAKRTMGIAQKLYEGIELGTRGTTALITYMRTDSVRIADEAQAAAAEYIQSHFGTQYLAPGGKRFYKTKESAQDAHEAIRPVDVKLDPECVKPYLEPDQYRIYQMIWSRFLASQMASALFHDTVIVVECATTLWRAKGERLLFDGFLKVAPRNDEENVELPHLSNGDPVVLKNLTKDQKFTQPSPRFSEASLVHDLEKQGIGRPSTYATIISTLQDRGYTTLENKHFVPTDLGRVVCGHLRNNFQNLMNVEFTAVMEKALDKVAEGDQNWVTLLKDFSKEFNPTLAAAALSMKNLVNGIPTDILCPKCGHPLQIKFGKAGSFLACSLYPECHFSSNYIRDEQGAIHIKDKDENEKVGVCPQCGKDLIVKKARTGSRFIACSGYPDCTYTQSFSTGVPCPQEGCNGVLVEKSSKKGKVFYACSKYPECTYAIWNKPVPQKCPKCGFPFLVEKTTKARGTFLACPAKGCNYSKNLEDLSGESPAK